MTEQTHESTFRVRVVEIDGSPGLIFPDEVWAKLGISDAGGMIDVIEDADGFSICRHTPDVSEQMDVARGVMATRRVALGELAKGDD